MASEGWLRQGGLTHTHLRWVAGFSRLFLIVMVNHAAILRHRPHWGIALRIHLIWSMGLTLTRGCLLGSQADLPRGHRQRDDGSGGQRREQHRGVPQTNTGLVNTAQMSVSCGFPLTIW